MHTQSRGSIPHPNLGQEDRASDRNFFDAFKDTLFGRCQDVTLYCRMYLMRPSGRPEPAPMLRYIALTLFWQGWW
jgi:hypothetical protein